MTNQYQNSWDHLRWRTLFKDASNKGYGFRELRIDVFENTLEIVDAGQYYIDDIKKELDEYKASEAECYDRPIKLSDTTTLNMDTAVSVVNADCLELAELLYKMGQRPCVLNMANRRNPGGGVFAGSGAQEENIFRRSNLHRALFQFVDYGSDYGATRNPTFSYPLDRNYGAVYTPNVTIFRASEANGYCLLNNPYKVAIITIPAISQPPLEVVKDQYKITKDLVPPTKEKIRIMLRIAISKQHDSLILSAFGCGAFKNPPNHMAVLFQEVFEETEFKNKIKLIVFAIIDDHNASKAHNPDGNVLPFFSVFDKSKPN